MTDLSQYAGDIESIGPGPCVSAAVTEAMELVLAKQGIEVDLSIAFLFYTTREFQGVLPAVGSWSISDALWLASTVGLPDEALWGQEHMYESMRPSDEAYDNAALHKLTGFHQLPTDAEYALRYPHFTAAPLDDRIRAEIDAGNPVVVYMRQEVGNHAMTVVGYDGDNFLLENEYGEEWGDHGFWHAPASFVDNVFEAWAIESAAVARAPGVYLSDLSPTRLAVDVVLDAPTKVWIGAIWNGELYVQGVLGWGTEVVPYATLPAGETQVVVAEGDLGQVSGAEIYVATGETVEVLDIVSVCTIPEVV